MLVSRPWHSMRMSLHRVVAVFHILYLCIPCSKAVVAFSQFVDAQQTLGQRVRHEPFLDRIRRLARPHPVLPVAGRVADGLMRRESGRRATKFTKDQKNHWFGPGHGRWAPDVDQIGVDLDGEIASRLAPAGHVISHRIAPDRVLEAGSRGERLMRRHPARQLGNAEPLEQVARAVAPVQYFVVIPITMGSVLWTTAIVASVALAAYISTRGFYISDASNSTASVLTCGAASSKTCPCRCSRRLLTHEGKKKLFDDGAHLKAGNAAYVGQEADEMSDDDDSLPRPNLPDSLGGHDEPEPEMEALVAGVFADRSSPNIIISEPSLCTLAVNEDDVKDEAA